MVLTEAVENQQRFFSVTCLDVMQLISAIVNEAFLDHSNVLKEMDPANFTQNLSFCKI